MDVVYVLYSKHWFLFRHKSLVEQLEGQFLINEWTLAFLTDVHSPKETTPLGMCNQEEPPSKKQKETGKGKERRIIRKQKRMEQRKKPVQLLSHVYNVSLQYTECIVN